MTADRSEAGSKVWAAPTLEGLTIDLTSIAAKVKSNPDGAKGTHNAS